MAPPRPTIALTQFAADFDILNPLSEYVDQEQRGNMEWSGGVLPFIEENKLPKHTLASLPLKMQTLIKSVWDVKASAGQSRGNIQIGQGDSYRDFNGQGPRTAPGRAQAHALALQQRPAAYQNRTAPYAKAAAVSPIVPMMPTQVQAFDDYTKNGLNWRIHKDFQLVNAYTFRGDRRSPQDIRAAQGFHPPITRTDQHYIDNVIYPQFAKYMRNKFKKDVDPATFTQVYHQTVGADASVMHNYLMWWSLVEQESYHVGKMLVDETLKGYTSSSRAVTVAKGFARTDGWVYVLLIEGGFLLPSKGRHEWTGTFGEEEIARLGQVPWKRIFGFRQVGGDYKFKGPIYLRKSFTMRPKAYQEVHALLSGKPQH